MLTELDPDMRVADLTLADLERLIEVAVQKALAQYDPWEDLMACALASESVLAEDWNSPEDIEAWQDLAKAMLP